ncbi:hypothetical protein GCM10027162_72180 [Streptomyces incanus]
MPESLVSGLSFADSYAYLDDWVLTALGDMGIKAWYQPLNDIATEVGKIAGAAQKRLLPRDGGTGAVLHHVTMSYDIDADKMLEVLRIGKENMSDKGTTSAKKRVDPLRRQTGLSRSEVIDRMIASFRTRYGLTVGHVTRRWPRPRNSSAPSSPRRSGSTGCRDRQVLIGPCDQGSSAGPSAITRLMPEGPR